MTSTCWIVNDNDAEELQLGGTPTEQVQDWDIDHPSPDLTNTGPVYFSTGPNPVTQTLNVIIENEIQNESPVNPNVQSDEGTLLQNGRQMEIELENASQEVQIPKINLEFDEECNWFEKTCTGSKLIRPSSCGCIFSLDQCVTIYKAHDRGTTDDLALKLYGFNILDSFMS